jgi:hypothetical protein
VSNGTAYFSVSRAVTGRHGAAIGVQAVTPPPSRKHIKRSKLASVAELDREAKRQPFATRHRKVD